MDHVFEVLAHPRRRYLLYTLLEETEWGLRELAEKIATWENDVRESTVSDDGVERVYVSLYHNHVPLLVEEGIIEFEETTETIGLGPHADQVLAVLENAGGSNDSDQETHARSDIR
ncbi:DUF7344 domain-containing protein [Haloprofundus salilacus]|uniref:DUF7344 domain-containing protein n=1 Tax=Haloprofundus salilacus TaxID=2876190 RepID=UPI001CCE6710|nr:hypothetical protein [Haloprofundus salilacus]